MESFVNNALKTAKEFGMSDVHVGVANIKVVGCGGGGSNTVTWLHKKGIQGAEVVALNTDKQHLEISSSDYKVLIGKELTRGLGCGGFPEKGREAAKESLHDLKKFLKEAIWYLYVLV